MERFVIERFEDGELLTDGMVECDQRLLNEQDLDVITIGKERGLLFVRKDTDINRGYYVSDDYRWEYGERERAEFVVKSRIK